MEETKRIANQLRQLADELDDHDIDILEEFAVVRYPGPFHLNIRLSLNYHLRYDDKGELIKS